jgi:hypothetical protein
MIAADSQPAPAKAVAEIGSHAHTHPPSVGAIVGTLECLRIGISMATGESDRHIGKKREQSSATGSHELNTRART